MIMKRLFAIVIAVLAITSLLTFSDNVEGTDNLDGKTKETAIVRTVSLDVNQTKMLHFNSNISNYEWYLAGDGYSYTIEQTKVVGKVEHTLKTNASSTFTDTWPSSGKATFSTSNADVTFIREGDFNCFSLAVSLKCDLSSDFYLKLSVTSYGITQSVYYHIYVTYNPVDVYTFNFMDVEMDHQGNFFSQGTMSLKGSAVDKTKFRFFAIGLYSGVSIHGDLMVFGVADDNDSRWRNSSSMPFTVVATNIQTNEVFVCPASINFTYDYVVDCNIEFKLMKGGQTILTEASSEDEVSVLENSDLTLSISNGTSAEVLYSDDNGTLRKYLWTPTTGSSSSPIATNGAGRYDILLTQIDGSTDAFTINVIATFVPVNKIYVTCSPV